MARTVTNPKKEGTMKTVIGNPFSSVWGKVTNVQIDPQSSHDALVTIAEKVLRLPHAESSGAKSLGLLRLTGQIVFLIVGENKADGKNFIFAGWKNPQSKVVLGLRPLIVEVETFELMQAILKEKPHWKAWKGSFSDVEVNQKTLWS